MKDKKITFNKAMDLMERGILSNRDFEKMCYNGQIEYEKKKLDKYLKEYENENRKND